MSLRFFALCLLLGLPIFISHAADKTELVFIASIHGAHKNHPVYDYLTLYDLVGSYHPDYVGVEIRPEDITATTEYLKQYYPLEMIELSQQYKGAVFGFDWLGEQITGMQIPTDYFKNLNIIKLQHALSADEKLKNNKPARLDTLTEQQLQIVKTATPFTLNNGQYGMLTREKDALEEQWLANTDYMQIVDFNKKRDKKIADNIIEFVSENKGKRIVLVMGADHRTFAIENVKQHFGDEVTIMPVAKTVNKP
ncbi:hypothetical protein [Arsukibacterium sp.]|uniref:hypothetical protein n=1 Tax=Arsukibacterium sp. TaxID=1977258 RepID=UPI00299D6475|nr:hypothetical protein [Arsukibacterium sp.]MDX1677750.1 hypothetical protein [Arsukibacterium sp.]